MSTPVDSPVAPPGAPSTDSKTKRVGHFPRIISSLFVFFHGLQTSAGARPWKDTWRQRDDVNCIWPGVWLVKDLGEENVLVLSLSYDADATRWGDNGNTESVEQIGSNLVQDFVTVSEWASVLKKPIVLVGHSFGGLVIKGLLVEADKQAKLLKKQRVPSGLALRTAKVCKKFRDNVKGIVFYGVPRSGSDVATMARGLNDAAFKSLRLMGISKNLEPFERKMEQLTVNFREAVGNDIEIYAFAEGRSTFGGVSLGGLRSNFLTRSYDFIPKAWSACGL